MDRKTDNGWYERRNELEPGMVFRVQERLVKLESRVPGDGTRWQVLDRFDGWCDFGSVVEPGDLEGEPLPFDFLPSEVQS